MSKYFFLFLIVCHIQAFSQGGFINKTEAKNKYDKDQKTGKWIEYKDSAWKTVDLDQAVYYHLVVYEKNVPVGIGRDYYLNNQLQNEYCYVNGVKNGPAKWYYQTGELRGIGSFKNNLLEGKATWYYTNGKIMQEEHYTAGVLNGTLTWYFDNGAKETEVNFTDGKKNGLQKWYYKESGKLYYDVNYINGKKNGVGKTYHEEKGFLVGEINYENDKKQGKEITLYNDGKLRSECLFVNDKQQGVYKLYYESGQLKREIAYDSGKIHGRMITYWNNGQTKRNDLYENNKVVKGATYDSTGTEVPYYDYEKMPEYPGGILDLSNFIKKEVVYPRKARKDGITGRVIVKFVVDTDGSVTDVSIVTSVSPELDEEAIRVVKNMPKWIPASIDGEKVKVYYNLPIRFSM